MSGASPPKPVVTGVGIVTPAGRGCEPNWAAFVADLGGSDPGTAAADPVLDGLPWRYSCRVPDYDPQAAVGASRALRFDRHTQFAHLAALEALEQAGLHPADWDRERVAVVCGTAAGGPETVAEQQRFLDTKGHDHVSPYLLPRCLPNMAAGALAIELGARGPCLSTVASCASGSAAVGVAAMLIRSGACDIALAGAADAAITPLYVTGFGRMGALAEDGRCHPFDSARAGFVVGEGAAVLVVESRRHALGRGARPLARVTGYGATCDAHHVVAPDPTGAGAATAIRGALRAAGAARQDVDCVQAHGTGTQGSDSAEATAIHSALGSDCPVTSHKALTGHTLGAAGAVSAALTVLSLCRGIIPPVAGLRTPDPDLRLRLVRRPTRPPRLELALSQTFGFGGHNAVLALASP
ncbi:beta-ketoacyl-[acyl-carrier-protein] synthase family protein [Streptomyces sp. Ac-502]|uniref:beta-ketoacyl-[acyl-carrier-protein] synthase family protein n=1 Tax=Streptomyces sp. Ac-502 TaxID=3342801 RepID=UPI00386268FD